MKNQKYLFLKPLTPIVLDVKQKKALSYENYEKALDEAFSCDEICNIALTGPYGAGKSTIMYTYEIDHKEDKKCIHISLAKFDDETGSGNGKYKPRQLEVKIINQLIHQISQNSISQTKFRIKSVVEDKKILRYTGIIFLLIVSVLYLSIVPASMLREGQTLYDAFLGCWVNWLFLFVAAGSLATLLYFIVKRQFISPLITSIQVDKNKIDLADKNVEADEHQFDRYMDELIYLFKQSKIDALVLDDIDRFDKLDIFSELREMNFLINKKVSDNEKEDCKTIKFFYMVKDELFTDYEQRTKFFDLIIPIVPVMDSSNSYELMKKLMEENQEEAVYLHSLALDMKSIQMICLYIHDYRVLKNIYNEFLLYCKQLKVIEHELSATKLFAMITYKNLWPEDYAKLQRKEGVVYDIFANVEKFREKRRSEIAEEISKIEESIKEIEDEHLSQMEELECIYFKYPDEIPANGYFTIDSIHQNKYESQIKLISALKKAESIVWKQSSTSKTYNKKDIQAWFAKLQENPEYVKRKEGLERKVNDWRNKKELEIRKKREQMEQLYIYSLSELLISEEYDAKASMQDEKKRAYIDSLREDLVLIFIREGLISEDYESYMTYFYPYDLSEEELRYLNSVRAGKNKEKTAEIPLKRVEKVVENLRTQDYRSRALPNYDLLLYAYETKNTELCKSIIKLLEDSDRIDFMVKIFEKDMNDAIKDVMVYWPNAWNQIICSEKISWLDKKEIFMKLLRITNVKSIWDKMLSDNSINILNEHVEEIFIDCNVEEIQTCINIGLKIPDLAESNLEEEKLNIIYEKRAFEFSRKNVEYVFTKEGEDAETIVIKILNEDISSYEQKVEFIAYIPSMCLKNIAMVEEHRLWSVLMENDKIVFNAKNIVELWRIDEVFTDEMRAFLLRHIAKTRCGMKWEDMITLLGENEDKHPLVNKMFKQIIEMENMGEGYVRLVTDLGAGYNTFSFDEISKEHVELLLCQTGVVHMTTANLEYVRTNMRRNVLLTWIIKRINTYISLMKNEGLRIEDELHALISDKRTDDNEKCSLLSLCKEPIEFSDKYNSIVVSEILSKDLFDANYSVLFNRYATGNRYSRETKAQILEYAKEHIENIITCQVKIPKRIMDSVIKDEHIEYDEKLLLLSSQAKYILKEEMIEYLLILQNEDIVRTIEGKYSKTIITDVIEKLLEALKSQKWISSFKEEGDDFILYPKRNAEDDAQ